MASEDIRYVADGVTMHGRLYWDAAREGLRPGVLVFPEGLGISAQTYAIAARLAESGFAALACDYYGGGYCPTDLSDPDAITADTLKRLEKISNGPKLRARGQGAYDVLRARPEVDQRKMAAIGYCFGGTMALELAFAGLPLAAAVGFHSALREVTTADAKNVKGRLLICIGTDDPWVPPEQRVQFEADMTGKGVAWQLNVYGGIMHSFTNPTAKDPKTAVYDPCADRDSWAAMMQLFATVFAD